MLARRCHNTTAAGLRANEGVCRLNLGGGFEFENAADAMGNLPLLTKGCGSEWLGLEPSLPRQGRFPTASDARIAQESQTHFECHAGRTSDAQDSVKPEPEVSCYVLKPSVSAFAQVDYLADSLATQPLS